jgi:hypothetical protein
LVPPGVPKSVLTQNQHLALSTQQAELSWLNTRAESETCKSIFLKLTKDKTQLDKNVELVGWYQTVLHLRLESQVKRHIDTTSYLSAVWTSFGSSKHEKQDIAECMT